MSQKTVAYLFILLTLVLAACTPVEPDIPTVDPTALPPTVDGSSQEPTGNGQQVYVDSLDVLIMESFPVQVSVDVRGHLANPCVMLNGISAEYTPSTNTFTLNPNATTDPDAICAAVLEPFEAFVALDVDGLTAGEYTVIAGNVQTTFTLDMDNGVEPETTGQDVQITLERTACFGTCPVYTITIYGDGSIVYDGRNFVDAMGEQFSTISPQAVADLVQAMTDIGYFDLADSYTNYYVTDMPSVLTSLTVDGKTKHIERYMGDEAAPLSLVEIEVMIDTITNSEQWTGVKREMPNTVGLPNPAAEPTPPVTSGELDKTSWEFIWGEVDGETLSPFADRPITINFEAGGISGDAGCNNYFSDYTIAGEMLTIGLIGSTMMACDSDLMLVEQQFLSALESARLYTMQADTLTLQLESGALHFSNAQPVEKTLFVGAEQVDCMGVAPQTCLLVKDVDSAEWEYFYDAITGFEWEAGYEYELRVRIIPVENPPADASSVVYELIELVSKTAIE